MSQSKLNTAAYAAIENEGIVAYEQQTPEQRRQFLGRIKMLLFSRILSESLRENYKFVLGCVPDNPSSKELKILSAKMKQTQKSIAEIIPLAKTVEQNMTAILAASESASERIDEFSWNSYQLLDLLMCVQNESMPEAIKKITDIIKKQK